MSYDQTYIDKVIRERAAARRERQDNFDAYLLASGHPVCHFPDWLKKARFIDDWTKLRPYVLWQMYLDYEMECIRNQTPYEHPKLYGVYNTLFY